MILINVFLITAIVCFIVDISGFVDSIKRGIWRLIMGKDRQYQEFNMKPFDCSLCLSFWSGLIYLLCVGQFNIPMICFVAFMALLSGVISKMMKLVVISIEVLQDKILSKIE